MKPNIQVLKRFVEAQDCVDDAVCYRLTLRVVLVCILRGCVRIRHIVASPTAPVDAKEFERVLCAV